MYKTEDQGKTLSRLIEAWQCIRRVDDTHFGHRGETGGNLQPSYFPIEGWLREAYSGSIMKEMEFRFLRGAVVMIPEGAWRRVARLSWDRLRTMCFLPKSSFWMGTARAASGKTDLKTACCYGEREVWNGRRPTRGGLQRRWRRQRREGALTAIWSGEVLGKDQI